ncbi:MAG: FkbM family methyltransferase [Actinobacteria bacterium]|nr:MAG: FkbM family methyltransferase [Actinomycetota bacterium]
MSGAEGCTFDQQRRRHRYPRSSIRAPSTDTQRRRSRSSPSRLALRCRRETDCSRRSCRTELWCTARIVPVSEPEFEHLERFLDKTGVFIEVGANTGKHSIKAAKHYGDNGVVIAIEPNPEILATLHRSIRANGFTNVRLRNLCMGERRSSGLMWMNNHKPVMFSLVKNDERAESFSTLTLTLDELFAWEGLDRLDFLKICAEGAEAQVLAGGRETITKHRPIIEVESLSVDPPIDQPEYTCFKAPAPSISKFWMPNEHPKIDVPQRGSTSGSIDISESKCSRNASGVGSGVCQPGPTPSTTRATRPPPTLNVSPVHGAAS